MIFVKNFVSAPSSVPANAESQVALKFEGENLNGQAETLVEIRYTLDMFAPARWIHPSAGDISADGKVLTVNDSLTKNPPYGHKHPATLLVENIPSGSMIIVDMFTLDQTDQDSDLDSAGIIIK